MTRRLLPGLTFVVGLTAAAAVLHADVRDPMPDAASLTATPTLAEADAVIAFWEGAGPRMWFAKDPDFDRRFRERFAALHEAAAADQLGAWESDPRGVLALVLLLDQYPRNAFRGTARMYATDVLARRVADAAIKAGHDRAVPDELALFVYLPLGHSESLVDQDRSVMLSRRLGEPNLGHAVHHREIIRRFGRFPHRNPLLGRTMTDAEQRYLDDGGYQG
ncbi:MAG: DUF924 family protein [Deltaproteobacteria bacterium]|nr:DUF924 family protein [Nannocystaceae bacterium]